MTYRGPRATFSKCLTYKKNVINIYRKHKTFQHNFISNILKNIGYFFIKVRDWGIFPIRFYQASLESKTNYSNNLISLVCYYIINKLPIHKHTFFFNHLQLITVIKISIPTSLFYSYVFIFAICRRQWYQYIYNSKLKPIFICIY